MIFPALKTLGSTVLQGEELHWQSPAATNNGTLTPTSSAPQDRRKKITSRWVGFENLRFKSKSGSLIPGRPTRLPSRITEFCRRGYSVPRSEAETFAGHQASPRSLPLPSPFAVTESCGRSYRQRGALRSSSPFPAQSPERWTVFPPDKSHLSPPA